MRWVQASWGSAGPDLAGEEEELEIDGVEVAEEPFVVSMLCTLVQLQCALASLPISIPFKDEKGKAPVKGVTMTVGMSHCVVLHHIPG